jgi:hypothetical protein
MKVPVWLMTILCGAAVAVMGFFGKTTMDVKADVASQKAVSESHNTNLITHERNNEVQFIEIKAALDRQDSKLDDIYKTIIRMDRRGRDGR